MKKALMKLACAVALLFFAQSDTEAQLQLGGGLAFGTEIESIGITLKGNYPFTETIRGSGSFTFFFPNTGTEFLKLRLWELNADGHYILVSNEKVVFYPLAGLNIAGVKFDYTNDLNNPFFPGDITDTEVGLNIGAGGNLIITESILGFAEIKYTISGFDQLVLNAGVLFQLGS